MPAFSANKLYLFCPEEGKWLPVVACGLIAAGERPPSSQAMAKVCKRCLRSEGSDALKPLPEKRKYKKRKVG